MTDTTQMIREVCEALGKYRREIAGVPVFDTGYDTVKEFHPDTDYNDTHLLIEWMLEAGWLVDTDNDRGFWCACFSKRDGTAACVEDADFRFAVLYATHKAVVR